MISDCAKWKRSNLLWPIGGPGETSLLVGLTSKLRSKARVATIADDEKPDGPEAVGPEENGSDTVQDGDPDLGSGEVCEEFGTEEVDQLVKDSGDIFE